MSFQGFLRASEGLVRKRDRFIHGEAISFKELESRADEAGSLSVYVS